jgi:membrane protein
MTARELAGIFRTAAKQWWDSRTFELGAALAYYSMFSVAPILVIALWIAGLLFGQKAAEGHLESRLSQTLGPGVSGAIVSTLKYVHTDDSGRVATALSLALLVFGALGVFNQMQAALDNIWNVEPKPGRGLWGVVKDRLLSFLLVVLVGVLLLASLVVNAVLGAVGSWLDLSALPASVYLWGTLRWVVSLALLTVLFALVYRILPDVKIAWRDVWIGALTTSVLFTVGNYLIGLYLGRGSVTSAYGAAGSLVIVLMWVYYSSQILLFGAEFTQVYACRTGRPPEPTPNAMRPTAKDLARHGIPCPK